MNNHAVAEHKRMTKIYLISPPSFEIKTFAPRLEAVLKTGLVSVFQLRLKDYPKNEIIKIAHEVKKICAQNNCLFIVNDSPEIAWEVGAGGVHLGEGDGLVSEVRKKSPQNFVIGASCYNSRHLAMEAAEQGADYLAFGAFFPTSTKIVKAKAEIEILEWASEMLNVPIVAIGGINEKNAASLAKAGTDFVAVISSIWENKDGEVEAVKKLHDSISN